jgi:hypothetical protein
MHTPRPRPLRQVHPARSLLTNTHFHSQADGSATRLDDDLESRPCAVQCGGLPGRATAGDAQVDYVRLASAVFSTLIRVLSSAAFGTEQTSAVIQAVCTSGSAAPSAATAT